MLGDVLPQTAFVFLMIMTRIGAMIMLLPALGDQIIPARVRVGLAMLIAILLTMQMVDSYPVMPSGPFNLLVLIFREALIGIMIGTAARLILASVHTTGTLIAFQTGLAAAQSFDPSQGSQSALVASLMTLMAVVLIFTMDMHHLMILGMQHSYITFPTGQAILFGDFATVTMKMVTQSFALGVQLATPFIVYGVLYNLGLGLIARLMPSLPVFFVGMPLNIMIGFALLAVTIGSILTVFMSHFEQFLLELVG